MMRKIWLLVGLLGCADKAPGPESSAATAHKATASTGAAADTPSGSGSAPPKKAGAKGGKNRGTKATSRSSGNVPRTAAGGLSKAEQDARMVARCTDGNVVFGFWQGEYPTPVVQLDAPLRTKVRTDPCGGTVKKGCTVPKGLYHPWAQDQHRPDGISFAVRTTPETWRITKAHSIAGKQRKAGTTVEVLTYLSEGYCSLVVGGAVVEDMCPGTSSDAGLWKRVSPESAAGVQMIKVQCEGGSTGWLTVDDAFMKQSGVREGQMQGYGEVAPAR